MNYLLSTDANVHDLIARAQALHDRAEDLGVIDEVQAAYRKDDEDRIRELMGFTSSEMNAIRSANENDVDAILAEYPEVEVEAYLAEYPEAEEEASQQLGLGQSNVHLAFDGKCLDRPASVLGARPQDTPSYHFASAGASVSASDCQWLQFTAALYLCTLAGPVGYWPCAYLASCTYCENAFTDVTCF